MPLAESDIEQWAGYLADAVIERREVAAITRSVELSIADAYRIQAAGIAVRLSNGERIVGAKTGLTSRAKQQQMGVDEPIFGVLTDAMPLLPEEGVDLETLIHARCEPEIVFRLGEDLGGPTVSPADVLDATATIHCLLYTSPSPRDKRQSRMPSSA